MSGTASRRSEHRLSRLLFVVWGALLAVATIALVYAPVQEILIIEVVIFSFAVLYGFGVWDVWPAVACLVIFGGFAASVMVPRALNGKLPPVELVEVVAPLILAGVVMFHVRRREQAVARANELAEADGRRARARERLSRMTSHELRTPLTIATGYVDHLLEGEDDEPRREDLLTVRDELVQLARVSDRLVRAVALDLGAPDGTTDVCTLLDEVRRRWSVVVDRDLVVHSAVHLVPVDEDRLRAALDTLVENSVRYTDDGDRICLFSASVDGHAEVGVEDAGPGLSDELISHITSDTTGAEENGDAAVDTSVGEEAEASRLRDMYSRTGFGLRLVAGIARAAGGRVVASRSTYGGARVALAIPLPDGGGQRVHDPSRLDGARSPAPSG